MKNSMLWLCRCGEESNPGNPHPVGPFQAQHKLANEEAGEVISGLAHSRWKETHMKIAVTYGEALEQETSLLVLGVWEGESLPRPVAGLIEDGDWNGKFKQTTLLYPRGEVPARRGLLVGLGK